MAVDHVDDLQFVAMQLFGGGGAAIFDDEDTEAFIAQRSHGRADALVGKDARDDDVFDAHIAQDQPQVRSRQRTVGGFGYRDLIPGRVLRSNVPKGGVISA